ncbi:MAG: VWA domain-containing protein [Phycisphaerales bacterium]|nr:MAG: VWA domain-containing protein [Phycisphaerales bacterium]
MRSIGFDNPMWLGVALVALPLALLAIRAFRTMSPIRRITAAVVRVALYALLGLALAGASAIRPNDRLAVVVVADVSGSVQRYGPAGDGLDVPATLAMRRFIEAAGHARGPQDLLGVVAFAHEPMPVLAPTAGPVADRPLPDLGDRGTDIAAALRAAAAMIPPDAAGRIVLISDGNQTQGDALAQARRLSQVRALGEGVRGGLPIDVVPIEYQVRREVMVEFVHAPPRAEADSLVPVRVGLSSTAPAAGTLRLLVDGQDVGLSRRVLLDEGTRVERFEVPLPAGRIHRFEAVFEPEQRQGQLADTSLANNRGQAFTITPGQGSVLLVHRLGHEQDVRTLAQTLAQQGVQVQTMPADGLPSDLVRLEAYDLVALVGVGAEQVAGEAQLALTRCVTELGCGLVMVGGERSFGAGGWRGSPVEAILPVHLDLPQSVQVPEVAIAIVLDNSGSMRRSVLGSTRSQQQIANEAAALAVLNMQPSDQVAVVTFNSSSELVVPIGPNDDPQATADRIRRITSGGGTRLGPALRLAAEQVASVPAKSRHIIVLTDGLSADGGVLPALAGQIHAQGITISTIAVGDGADTDGMRRVAEIAGGTFYNVINPNVLPQVFLSEVQVTRSPLVREGTIVAVVLPVPSPVTAGLGVPPPLLGINLTRPRRDPTVTLAMATDQGEPLLAHWNAGVGRVAAFTSDAHRWAEPWIGWPGYARFWGQLVGAIRRSAEQGPLVLRVEQQPEGLGLELEAIDPQGLPIDGLAAQATVYDPQGQARQVDLTQTAPGTYEASVPTDQAGTYVVAVRPRRDDEALPPIVAGVSVPGGREYRLLASDLGTLQALAQATGGRVLGFDQAGEVFDRNQLGTSEARSPLWRLLLGWAIAVLVLDIATRRLAWDRLVSSAFGAQWLRSTVALARQGRQAAGSIQGLRQAGRQRGQRAVERIRRDAKPADETDAQRSAYAAQQRILQARLASPNAREDVRPADPTARHAPIGHSGDADRSPAAGSGPSQPKGAASAGQDEPTGDHPPAQGLLAAKRRARARYEQD